MQSFILLASVLTSPLLAVSAAPPAKQIRIVRPALSWSDLGRVSDGGGPALASKTALITETEKFVKTWKAFGFKDEAPRVNFEDYFAVVVFRQAGLDFQLGGLVVDSRGEATVTGLPAIYRQTNAGWYSTTIGIFPRRGITSVEGKKLPVGK